MRALPSLFVLGVLHDQTLYRSLFVFTCDDGVVKSENLGRTLAMVDWSKQLVLFVLAAIFSLYWTGKQGLWDVMSGETSWDKDWKEAKQLLARHIVAG